MGSKFAASQAVFESLAGVRASVALDYAVLDLNATSDENERVLEDTALIPLYAAAISVVVPALHGISLVLQIKRLINRIRHGDNPPRRERRDPPIVISPTTFIRELEEHIREDGELSFFIWNILRLCVCLALLGLTVYAAIIAPGPEATPGANLHYEADDHKK